MLKEEGKEPYLSEYFQKDKISEVHQSFIDVELDALNFLLCDGQHQEADHFESILKDNPIQKEKEVEEDEEVEEEEESNEESEGYQISEEVDE